MDIENEKNEMQPDVEVEEIQETSRRRNPINYILIGLIVLLVGLLVFQFVKMNNVDDNYDDLLNGEDNVTIVEPTKTQLSTELFDCESILLDFADITLNIENEDIREYYDALVSDMSNFTEVKDKIFIPADNIFELRFKEAATSIYFFNEVVDNSVYCTVVHNGAAIGNYLVPSIYYGNLFNIVRSSEDVTNYTANIVKENVASLVENAQEVAIPLNNEYAVTDTVKIETFEAQIKNVETATMVFQTPENQFVVVCYMNFKYYVFLADAEGQILESGNYEHYNLWDFNSISCYNGAETSSNDNIKIDVDYFYLKVVK